jgi:hypothetical protein
MTRVYEKARQGGGTRLLVIGGGHYPNAARATELAPRLPDVESAAKSAIDFASAAIGKWRDRFPRALASVDLLVNSPAEPGGCAVTLPDGTPTPCDPPSLAAIKAARSDWMAGAGPQDRLLLYCCGHGIWLPSVGRTFLASSFGQDPDNPWTDAIALDDLALALGDHEPRSQWLIFDCCNNTPPEALRGIAARADPLISALEGRRRAVEQAHGPLEQVVVASASPGAQAFGKAGRASRFMEAFLDACDGAGTGRMADGRWWIDQQGIEVAISTFRLRVAPIEEEDYFTFARVTRTDAVGVPRFIAADREPSCLMLVRSEPPFLLKRAALTVTCSQTGKTVVEQPAGIDAKAPLRAMVTPWLDYAAQAHFPEHTVQASAFAMPPLAEAVIRA